MTDQQRNARLPKEPSVAVETYGEDSRKNALDSTAAVLGDGGRPARVLTGTPPLRNESVTASIDGNDGMVDGDMDKRQARRSKQERKLNDKLPKWLSSSWVDKRKWKTFIRVMVAFFAMLILMVVNPSLRVQGSAGFFGLIVIVMLPPIMPSTVFIFAIATLVIGMCLGWAWGCAAMAASLAARNKTLLASQYTRAQSELVPGVNPDAQFQSFIFHGEFLDARASIVFAIFFFVGTYTLGTIRALAPKLTLLAIFGTIVLDVMCSYGPLFPSAQYTLATSFLIPTAFYVAVGLTSTILIFPQTLNHAVTAGIVDQVLKPIKQLVVLQEAALHTRPSASDAWAELTSNTSAVRKGFAQGLAAVIGQAGLLELELSRGRLSPADLKKVMESVKLLCGRAVGQGSFQYLVGRAHQDDLASDHSAPAEEKTKRSDSVDPHPKPRIQHMLRAIKEQEKQHGHGLDDLLPLLRESSSDLRGECLSALETAIDWLGWVNSHRWRFGLQIFPKGETAADGLQRRRQRIADLKRVLEDYRVNRNQQLLQPFKKLFDPNTGELLPEGKDDGGQTGLSTRSLFLCFVFSTNLVSYATALVSLLETLADIEERNPSNRIQWPTALGSLFKVATSPGDKVNPLEMGDPDEDTELQSTEDGLLSSASTSASNGVDDTKTPTAKARGRRRKEKKIYPHDPEADPPNNGVQRSAHRIRAVWRWQTSPQGIFALKYSLVSIALWVPAICPSSAYFVYTNKGLWALIMAQTGLGVFAGEQIGAFVLRMGGTLAGLVLGMLAWYMGNAKSNGNPYGCVAATMFVTAPFLYLRYVSPPHVMPFWLMIGVTIVLVVGYSWLDTHIIRLGDQGIGVDIAWRRALLVIIGFTAAFIITVFPFKPRSAKTSIRLKLAKIIDLTSGLFAAEVEGVLEEAEIGDDDYDHERRTSQYRRTVLSLVTRLQSIEPLMAQAAIEPGFKGPWPQRKYGKLLQLEYELLASLSLVSNAWSRMRPSWDKLLAERLHVFDPIFIADTMIVFTLLANGLRHGQGLPPLVPLRERLANLRLRTMRDAQKVAFGEFYKNQSIVPLTWESIQTEQMAIFATASVALFNVISTVDRLTNVVRSLVGERDFEALERMHERRAFADVETSLGRIV